MSVNAHNYFLLVNFLPVANLINKLPPLSVVTNAVRVLALTYFPAVRQTGFLFTGGMGVCVGVMGLQDETGGVSKVRRATWHLFAGCSLIISGLTGLIAELDFLKKGIVTAYGSQMSTCSSWFFLLSSLIGIKNGIDAYYEGKRIYDLGSPENQAEGLVQMRIAILELIVAISYTIASLLMLFAHVKAAVITFSVIAFLALATELLYKMVTLMRKYLQLF